jgi:ATP-dependent DNA helicase RecQ
MKSSLEILEKYWKYTQFREPQEEIINAVLNGENSLVLLPTGGGKSLCYQIPGLILDGVCIVISPLIALIQDQVNSLQEKNIKAIALTSQLSQDEIIIAFDNLQFGGYKFLYLSPEKLQSTLIQDKIKQLKVSLIAIDEAHCISEWGHDFRPSYLKLKVLKELKPETPIIALTATATKRVLSDIQQNLELEKVSVFKKSFQRNNLIYRVINTEDTYGKLLQLISKVKGSVIVYTNSRKQTKDVCNFLLRNNLNCSFYHGGLSNIEKNKAFTNWMDDSTPIMIATNAFGMGIDKPDVRVVLHINIPNSLENFIQEAGRAGRDGKIAYSLILTNNSILNEAITKFNSNTPTIDFIKNVYLKLNQYYAIALGEIPTKLFNFSLQEFCKAYELNILKTYNSLKVLEREDILQLDENYNKKSTLKIIISNNQIFNYLANHPSKSNLIKLILRSYGGIFEHFTIINELTIANKLNCSKNQVIHELNDLHTQRIINYSYENTTSKLTFLAIREDAYTINRISKNIERQNSLKLEKLKATISYIQNRKTCRNTQLLEYFNEKANKPCGKCDVCIAKNSTISSFEIISSQIILHLKQQPLTSQELTLQLNFSEKEILNSLKILLEKNKLTITSQNKFKLIGL